MSSRNQVLSNNTNSFPNNNSGQITPQVLRDFNADFINSVVFTDQTSSMAVGSAVSSSYATSASQAQSAVSAAFATNSVNAVNAATASFLTGTIASASFATSASFASTSSYNPDALLTASANVNIITFTKGDGSSFDVTVAVSGSVATASYAATAGSASFAQQSISASYALTASFAANVPATASFAISASRANIATTATSASYALNATSASYAATASSADVFRVRTALTASGLNYPTVDGTVEQFLSTNGAGTLSFANVRTLYQNIRNRESVTINKGTPLFVSGSTGDNADVYIADASNPARMPATLIAGDTTLAASATGRGIILGHIEGVNTTGYPAGTLVYVGVGGGWTATAPTGSAQVQPLGVVTREGNNGMGIVLTVPPNSLPNIQSGYTWVGNANGVPQAVATSSIQNVVSSSYAGFAQTIASGLNITASSLNVTNNATIGGNLTVNGTASFNYVQTVTGSAVIIGQEYIVLNTQLPASRYAGLKVYDSGSLNTTASIVWDSETNHWVYQTASGSSYSGGGFLAGPKNTGSLADITYPTLNRILRSQGDDHIYDSNIIDDGTVKIQVNTQVTGTLGVTGAITGNLTGTASFATFATSAGSATTATSASYALSASEAQHAVNADSATTATSASYSLTSTSASYALNSTSASFAQTAISASYAPDTTFPFTGSAGISGSLTINNVLTVTGSQATPSRLNLRANSTTATVFSVNDYIVEDAGSATFGGNIVTGTTATTATSSYQLSGSQNWLNLTAAGNNTQAVQGRRFGHSGRQNIIFATPSAITSSNMVLPSISTSWVGASITVSSSLANTASIGLQIVNSFVNSSATANATSGSVVISNTNINAATTITNTWASSSLQILNSQILGTQVFINTHTTASDASAKTLALGSSILAGNSVTGFYKSTTPTGAGIVNTIVVSNNFTLTGSILTSGNVAGAFFGSFPVTDGVLNDLDQVRFAVGTGTGSAAAARRTSLYVSASGLTVVQDSLLVTGSVTATSFTGSLLGTASYASNALSSSYSLVATSASFATSTTSASYALTSTSASYSDTSLSSSYALTASYVASAGIQGGEIYSYTFLLMGS